MRLRGLLVAPAVLTTALAAWSMGEDGPAATSERDRAKGLALGQELPPPRPEEDAATKVLVTETVASIERQKNRPYERDQHPKQHGAVRARFVVPSGLPESLRVGIFKEPMTYDAIVRFSNGRSHVDNVPDVHGVAIKLIGISGPKVLPSEADALTQDFILIDDPTFFAIDSRDLVEFTNVRKAMAAGDTSKAADFAPEFAVAKRYPKLGVPSPLEMNFHSVVPYRLGNQAVKYTLAPDKTNQSGRPAVTKDSPEGTFREAMVEHLTTRGKPANFAFGVQPQADPVKMPVENPMVLWDVEPTTVAYLTIAPQEFTTADQLAFCENLSFTPWHSLEAHRPLGGINRSRRWVYEASSALRHDKNGVPRKEPVLADLDRLYKP